MISLCSLKNSMVNKKSLILEKLLCSPHRLNNVNIFAKMEVKRLQSISPGMGMVKSTVIGLCNYLIDGFSFHLLQMLLATWQNNLRS